MCDLFIICSYWLKICQRAACVVALIVQGTWVTIAFQPNRKQLLLNGKGAREQFWTKMGVACTFAVGISAMQILKVVYKLLIRLERKCNCLQNRSIYGNNTRHTLYLAQTGPAHFVWPGCGCMSADMPHIHIRVATRSVKGPDCVTQWLHEIGMG